MWLVRKRVFLYVPSMNFRLWLILSQSQRRISPWSSNHGISPNDSVHYSGWPLPQLVQLPHLEDSNIRHHLRHCGLHCRAQVSTAHRGIRRHAVRAHGRRSPGLAGASQRVTLEGGGEGGGGRCGDSATPKSRYVAAHNVSSGSPPVFLQEDFIIIEKIFYYKSFCR